MRQIDRKKANRRTLHFDSMSEVRDEVERLAAAKTTTTGNHSFAKIMEHLARTFDVVTGHMAGAPIPLPIRLGARLMRPWILSRPMKPGFNLPSAAQSVFWPEEEIPIEEALTHFRESLDRFCEAENLPKHPLLGNMNRKQHDQLQCRHCELHLGFVHPID